jgi:hypothetical protein
MLSSSCKFDRHIGACYHHLVSLTDTSGMLSSSCEFDRHIGMLSSSCEFDRHIIILWVRQKHRHAMLLSVIIPLPNEDFGRPNKHFRTSFRSTFQGSAHSILATKRWKVLRKRVLKCWFGRPKSSFGEHKFTPPKRRCWKDEQKMKSGFSSTF